MGHLSGIVGEFVGNNRVVVQALQSRIIGTFWSILASPLKSVSTVVQSTSPGTQGLPPPVI